MENPKAEPASLAATIRVRRVELGKGVRELARDLDLAPTYISKLEAGHISAPSRENLKRLASCLELDPDLLCLLAGYLPEYATSVVGRFGAELNEDLRRYCTNLIRNGERSLGLPTRRGVLPPAQRELLGPRPEMPSVPRPHRDVHNGPSSSHNDPNPGPVSIRIREPIPGQWFRVGSESKTLYCTRLKTLDYYRVESERLRADVPGVRRYEVREYVTDTGRLFLWPLVSDDSPGRSNDRVTAHRLAAERGRDSWISFARTPDDPYGIEVSTRLKSLKPEFSHGLDEAIELAFADRTIRSLDDPVVQRLIKERMRFMKSIKKRGR